MLKVNSRTKWKADCVGDGRDPQRSEVSDIGGLGRARSGGSSKTDLADGGGGVDVVLVVVVVRALIERRNLGRV